MLRETWLRTSNHKREKFSHTIKVIDNNTDVHKICFYSIPAENANDNEIINICSKTYAIVTVK